MPILSLECDEKTPDDFHVPVRHRPPSMGLKALYLFDPTVEWSPTEGTYHGPEGVVSSLVEWFGPWEEHHVQVDEVTDAGDQVLAVVHLTGRGARSGVEIDQRFFQVYAVRSGKIIRMAEFVTRDEALEAARVPG